MVAIVTGNGHGLERSSRALLGAAGAIGNAALGRGGQNVYVNAATGTLNVQRQDEFLVGLGPDGDLATEFSTGQPFWHAPSRRGVFGLTGTENTAGSTITRSTSFNDLPVYTYDVARGAYVNKEGAGAHDEVRFANGVWSFIDGNTRTVEYYEQPFSQSMLVSRVVDADGNTQTYSYDSTGGSISRITNADGGYVEMTNTNGRPNEIRTHLPNASGGTSMTTRVRYTWDPANTARLLALTVDLTPQDNSIADGNVYRIDYGYDGSTQRLTSITQSDGSRLDIVYDTSGRVLSLAETVAAGVTRTTSFSYDSASRITTVTDSSLQSTQLWYDAQLRLTKIVSPPATAGAAPQTQLFTYNADGDVLSVTDPAGNVTAFQYDSNGNEIWRQDALGNIVSRTYGARNELLTETRVEGSAQTFTTSGVAPTVTGDKILGTGLNNDQWGSATSVQALTGSAVVSGRRYHPYNGYSVLGLADGPLSTTEPWKDYDFAFYFWEGSIHIWENGSLVQTPMASGASDEMACQIEYDGAKVFYRINGNVVRQTTAAAGMTFRAAVSANWAGRGVQDIVFAPAPAATTRYVYDSENHLRFVLDAEGAVTEYRYDVAGRQVAQLVYTEQALAVAGLAARQSFTETALAAWVSALADKSSVKRTNTYYDARGQVSSVASYTSLSKAGEGTESPLAVVPGANTTVTPLEGLYRITKTAGSPSTWDADAHSLVKVEGDFVLSVRPGQTDKDAIGGMAAAPAAGAHSANVDYGFYFLANGTVRYTEKGYSSGIGTYTASDTFWLERVGSTISYYKGATLAAAKAAGALRTQPGAGGALYFDSSISTTGGFVDVGLTPRDVVTGVNTAVAAQPDGLYRVTKTAGGTWDWNADARSTAKADGDFVLRLRPNQNDRQVVGGVATAPAANASYTNPNYGFLFHDTGLVCYTEAGAWTSLGVNYKAGDNFWLVRTGSTIGYYKGATLEAAVAAGALRTRTGASGTFYFDSSFLTTGASMDVAFAPSAIVNGENTIVTAQGDGLQRVTKIGSAISEWNAEARSTTQAGGDFVLRLRPVQNNAYMVGGVATIPATNTSYWNPDYGFYFTSSGVVQAIEAGTAFSLGTTYSPGDNFWLVRAGNAIGYYRGATLEAAMAAGALRTSTAVSGTFHFDSSLFTPGAAVDVAFTPVEAGGGSAGVTRTNYIYDPAGRLLSRATEGQQAETFLYDGLGRLVATTDRNQGTTSIVFNDAATQTIVTLASGLVRTSTYNKAGDLISLVESGGSIAPATATSKYDKLGRLRMTTAAGFSTYFVYDKVGRLVAEVNHRGDLVEYRYDASDRLIATTRYANSISAANLAVLADPNSTIEMPALRPVWHQWDIWNWRTYDKEGRLTSTMDGTIRTYEYDKSGRLIKSVAYYNELPWSLALAFQANPPASPFIPTADSRDSVARNFYDKQGRLVAALDGEGYLTRNVYDRAGQLIETVAYFTATAAADRASGTLAQLLAQQPAHAEDRRARFVYDGQGQLRYEIDSLNQVTEYRYNGAQQLIATIRHAGSIPVTGDYGYDNVKGLVAASRLATSPPSRKSWNVYDGSGRLAYAINPEGAVASYSYDNMGQVTKTVQFAAVRVTASAPGVTAMNEWAAGQSANAANRVTRNYFSARGERGFTVDAEGYVTRTDFDAAGRATREVRWDLAISANDALTIDGVEAAAANAGGWAGKWYTYGFGGPVTEFRNGADDRTEYLYYGNGTKMREVVAAADNAFTYFQYDAWGRLKTSFEANGTPEGATVIYDYDGHGNLDSVVDARSNATTRTFDHLGRVKTETNAAAGIVTYDYNGFGELTKVTDARGNATTHSYDRLGRVRTTVDALNNVTSYSYDEFGDLREVTRGTATTRFDYDLAGRVTRTTDAEGHEEAYDLNAFGDRVGVTNKLGGTVVNAYDRRGLLVEERLPMASVDSNGTTVAPSVTNRFEYDSRGNRTRKIEAFGLAEARTTSWYYDRADRLVETRGDLVQAMHQTGFNSATWVVPTEKLKYDHRGRVTERTDALGGRTLYYYDRMSRVTVELAAAGTYTAYTYDKNGNMLTRRVHGIAAALPAVAGGSAPPPPAGEYRETAYTYDALNRLTSTSVAGLRTGAWNEGSNSYQIADGTTATTTIDYDSNGNVVRTTGAGASTYVYYDKENRKIAEVDRESYLTFLTLDGEGNVVREDRYATRVSDAAIASDPHSLRAAAIAAAAGNPTRTTLFTYDRNGRRVSEKRLDVNAHRLDGGVLTGGSAHSEIGYSYNGLGEVTRKTEANGDVVDYSYDLAGRLVVESRASYSDQAGASVRPTVAYAYNGINALSRTRQGGAAAAAGDRVTRYHYGDGGRLASMTDANGATYDYYYDAAGNVVRESYQRVKADQAATHDALLTTRDGLGRVTSQVLATWNGSGWTRGDSQDTAYNAYGDVVRRGVNGLWQEQLFFDSAGRVSKSNAGDGVWRFFLYDLAGNRTLTLESEGSELDYFDRDGALSLATLGGTRQVGQDYVDGINATIAEFDRRGQQTRTRLPHRQLSGAASHMLTSARTYNAFGEATSETDALANRTDYAYNAMGRLVSKQGPTVKVVSETNAVTWQRPLETYFYDVSGRLIATEDANGNRVRREFLSGTGHNGSEALVTAEYHADGGILSTWYDVFGDARTLRNELGQDETRVYDAMGRMVGQTHRGGLTDHYGYDLLGQRIWHWNSLLGSTVRETTDYDMQGRVTRNVALGGDVTETSHAWSSALVTAGLGAFGGWIETTRHANGKELTEHSDLFGRALWKLDLGGHAFASSYDKAGRLVQRSGAETLSWSYYNTGLAYSVGDGAGGGSTYGYDAAGNKTYEYTTKAGAVVQNATAGYDALGRMTSWSEAGGAVAPASSTAYDYDLAGNIRHTHSVQAELDVDGAVSTARTVDYWYRYDSMNRVTTDKGELTNGVISGGTAYSYDSAGRRKTSTTRLERTARLYRHQVNDFIRYYTDDPGDMGEGTVTPVDFEFTSAQVETYNYDSAGYLQSVAIAVQDMQYCSAVADPQPLALGAAVVRAVYSHDAMGRVTAQSDYLADGTSVAYSRAVTYNAKGQVTDETTNTRQGTDTWASVVHTDYGAGAGYALGAAVTVTATDSKNGAYQYGTTTSNGFAWYDGAVQSSVSVARTGQTTSTSTYTYGGSGQIASVSVVDGVRNRTIAFTTDMLGQVIRRDEADAVTTGTFSGDPHEIWYRFNGRQIAFTGNNGTLDTDYASSIEARATAPAGTYAFRHGDWNGAAVADYDPSLARINSYGQGSAGGGYTVRAGDSLAGVALALWGNAALWYKLAEANGLSAASALVEGRNLIVPAGVQNNQHNAATLKPYDPSDTIGDTGPSAPKPQKKGNKCGLFGQILLVAIAVAVSVATYGALTTASTGILGAILAGGVSGAAGSIVSQGFGVATGIQQNFSFKAVALAALSSAVTAGLGKFAQVAQQAGKLTGALGDVGRYLGGSGFLNGAARGALGSAVTQGIGVAVGLQKKFDFVGVAAAGLANGVGNLAAGPLGAQSLLDNRSLANHLANAGVSAANAIANAATRSLVNGTDFGDNLIAALPDIIGSTIGNMMAFGVSGTSATARAGESDGNISGSLTHIGDGVYQIQLPDGTIATGNPVELRAMVEAQIADLGVPPNSGETTSGADRGSGEFRSGSATLTYAEDGTGNLAHDVIRNIVYGKDGAIVLGQWAEKFGARYTAFQMIDDLDHDSSYVLLLSHWAALNAKVLPRFGAQLSTISSTMAEYYQPDALITGRRAVTAPVAAAERQPDFRGVHESHLKVQHLNPHGPGETGARIGTFLIGMMAGSQEGLPIGEAAVAAAIGSAALRRRARGGGRMGDIAPHRENQAAARGTGLDSHHVGQAAGMRRLVPGYDRATAPTILVPKEGHTVRNANGEIVSRRTDGINSARDLLARDVRELRRVYPGLSNSQLQALIEANRRMYPDSFRRR